MISLHNLMPAALAAVALCGSAASAATFDVVSGDTASIVRAINLANSNGEADTINLSGAFNYEQSNNSTYGPTGFPVIRNDGPLTINGATSTAFIGRPNVTTGAKIRIFAIAPGARVTINNLRFFNGSASAGTGGSPDAAPNRGGAIYNAGGASLTLNNCRFDFNEAVSGGAIFNGENATTTINGGAFSSNAADANGGVVYNEGGSVALENATFSGNQARGVVPDRGGRGGAIYLRNDARSTGLPFAVGNLTVKNCVFGNGNGGNLAQVGGAISCESNGSVRIETSLFRGNRARFAGAIDNLSTLSIVASTFSDNSAEISGGAMFTQNGRVDISNSTFSGNSAPDAGSAIESSSPDLRLESCTLSNNMGAAALTCAAIGGYRSRVRNTIVSGNSSDVENRTFGTLPFDPSFESGGYNLIGTGNATSSFNAPGDQIGVTDPKLGPLRDNGGATPTRSPQIGSAGIDKGKSALPTDQIERRRPIDLAGIANAQGGDGSDIGAIEYNGDGPQTPGDSAGLFVNSTDDHDDGLCGTSDCTLREAMNAINARPTLQFIAFDGAVFGTAFGGSRQTIRLNGTALPTTAGSFTIGAPPPGVVIDAGGQSGIFRFNGNANVTLRGLTLQGGNTNNGGSAVFNSARATLMNCTLTGNRALFGGGAIKNLNGNLTLRQCTFSDNSSQRGAGTISNENGVLSVRSCTIAGSGQVVFSAGNISTNTTVAGSIIVAGRGSAVDSFVEADSPNGSNPAQNRNTFVSQGYNLITTGNAAGAFNQSGDRTLEAAADAFLLELRDNGGIVPTLALLPGSPAINAGDPAFRGDVATGTQFDGRDIGFARVRDGRIDIGAFEVQNDAPRVTVALEPRAPKTLDVLTARPTGSDPDGNAISYDYRWFRNGRQLNEFGPTLQLAKSGNGDKGDVISVIVRVTDSEGASATASAQATVINSAPFALSDKVSAPADVEKAFVLRGGDADGDALTFKRVGGPTNGTAEFRVDPSDGVTKLFYRSRARYGGSDAIRFVAIDSEGKPSEVSTLSINVLFTSPPPANRAPVAGDTNIDTVVGKSEVKGLLGSDPDGDAITFRIVNNAKFGRSEIKRDTDGQFRLFYTSLPRFFGNDRVTYLVTDSKGKESNLATVNINFANRSPVAQNNSLQVASGAPVSQFLFADDPDGDAVSFRLVNNPQFGSGEIKRDPQGAWRVFYQSVPGYVGPDRITFIAIDAQGRESQVATANINVVNVAPAPSALSAGTPPSSLSGDGS